MGCVPSKGMEWTRRRPGEGGGAALCGMLRSGPGAGRGVLGFEAVDGGGLFQREADVIQPVQQAMLAEGINLEVMYRIAILCAHSLRRQINPQLIAGEGFHLIE